MRFAIVDTYYPRFLDRVYARTQELGSAPYETQWRALMDTAFGTSDAYSFNLRQLGHEAAELVPNCDPLQSAWASENGSRALAFALRRAPQGRTLDRLRQDLRQRIALAQIRELDAEVVYCQDMWFFRREQLDQLRAEGRLVAGQIASRLPPSGLVQGYDAVFTSFPHFVSRLQAIGVDAHYLRLAFDERLLARISATGGDTSPESPRERGAVFVGSVDPTVHPRGTALLEHVCASREIDVWGYGVERLRTTSPIRRRFRGEAWGLEMFRVLSESRVALNRHIEASEGNVNNMRLFEATGMGALLLTDDGANMEELFARGTEVAIYRSEESLISQLDQFEEHEDERRAVAAAGQARVLREHTYGARIPELAAMINSLVAGHR